MGWLQFVDSNSINTRYVKICSIWRRNKGPCEHLSFALYRGMSMWTRKLRLSTLTLKNIQPMSAQKFISRIRKLSQNVLNKNFNFLHFFGNSFPENGKNHIEWIISQFFSWISFSHLSEYIVISIFMYFMLSTLLAKISSVVGRENNNKKGRKYIFRQDIKFFELLVFLYYSTIADTDAEKNFLFFPSIFAIFSYCVGLIEIRDKAIWIHYRNMTINYQFPCNIFQLQPSFSNPHSTATLKFRQ